jgi:ankyrin repeat protein
MAARELCDAAGEGDCGKLRELLDGGGASVVNERTEFTDSRTGEMFRVTALTAAVDGDQHDALELLLEHNADPNRADSRGATPLIHAAIHGRLRILRTLLDRKDIAIDAVNTENGCTAFHLACCNDKPDCAVELARSRCDMTLRTKNGMTGKQIAERLKHTAVLAGLRALVVEQLRAKQEAAAQTVDPLTATTTALVCAAYNGDCGKLRELLDGGGASVVNERTKIMDKGTGEKLEKYESTALIMAVISNQHAAVELLLERKADPNVADSNGCTPLMMAASRDDILPILQTLLDRKDIAIDAVHPDTVLTAFHYACVVGNADCAVELARHGCDTTLRTEDGETGKELAERKKHTAVLDGLRALVAEQEVTTQGKDPSNATIALELRTAAQKGDCGKLHELLDGSQASVVDERTEATGEKGEKVQTTALIEAVGSNQHAAVELLLERKADPNLQTCLGGYTPLMVAAARGHLSILQTLINRDTIAVDAARSNDGGTAFHLACLKGQAECAAELVRHGCDTTLWSKNSSTGLDLAKLYKHTAVLDGLRAHVLEQLRQSRDSGSVATDSVLALAVEFLLVAAKNGMCEEMHELLDAGGASMVNERTVVMGKQTGVKETTALIQAVNHDQNAAVELLLEHKANPNLADSTGSTPLMIAAFHDHLPILRTLLDLEDTAIDAVDPTNDFAAFDYACEKGNADCAVELVRHGCRTQLHGVSTKRCKLVQKLAVRKAQSQATVGAASSGAPAAATGGVWQADEDAEQQKKAAKKAASNRKKRDRKKAKKAAEQQLISQPEPEPEVPECPAQQSEEEPEPEPEPEPETEPEPEPALDERTQQLQTLTELGIQQWSAAQVLEWVALADLPPESVSTVIAAMESLGVDDGEELLHLRAKALQKLLFKHGAQDAEALAKQVIEQRDALLPGDSACESASPKSELSDILECPLCMELYSDDEPGLRVPRMLTSCGHTVCHGCITNMLTRVLAEGNAKPYKCPTCSKVTKVAKGKAGSLPRNFALAAALEAL